MAWRGRDFSYVTFVLFCAVLKWTVGSSALFHHFFGRVLFQVVHLGVRRRIGAYVFSKGFRGLLRLPGTTSRGVVPILVWYTYFVRVSLVVTFFRGFLGGRLVRLKSDEASRSTFFLVGFRGVFQGRRVARSGEEYR